VTVVALKQLVRYSRFQEMDICRSREIFCDCCGFDKSLLNGRQLVLAVCGLLHK